MALANLLEYWPCKNINLVLLWISGCGVENNMAIDDGIFWEKYWISVKRLIFLQIRHFFMAEKTKVSSKRWIKLGTYCTTITLSCNRWTAIWILSALKMTGQTDKPYFDPWPLYIFFYNMKEMSEFCKSVKMKVYNKVFVRLYAMLHTTRSLLVQENASHCSKMSKKKIRRFYDINWFLCLS